MATFGISTIYGLLIVVLSAQLVFGVSENLKLTYRFTECSESNILLLKEALESTYFGYSAAEVRTRRLLRALTEPYSVPLSHPLYTKGTDFSTFMLFETLFGSLYGPAGIRKVGTILDRITRLLNGLKDPTFKLDIACGLGFYWKNLVKDRWFDDRPAYWGGGSIKVSNPDCCDHHSAEHISYKAARADLIYLCPILFERRRWKPFTHPNLHATRNTVFSKPLPGLPDICWANLGFYMIHELSHSHSLLHNNPLRDHAYNWDPCVDLALKNPDLAIRNSDSFAFYVVGMALDLYDWSTGAARIVPPNFDGPLGRLIWVPDPQTGSYRWRRP